MDNKQIINETLKKTYIEGMLTEVEKTRSVETVVLPHKDETNGKKKSKKSRTYFGLSEAEYLDNREYMLKEVKDFLDKYVYNKEQIEEYTEKLLREYSDEIPKEKKDCYKDTINDFLDIVCTINASKRYKNAPDEVNDWNRRTSDTFYDSFYEGGKFKFSLLEKISDNLDKSVKDSYTRLVAELDIIKKLNDKRKSRSIYTRPELIRNRMELAIKELDKCLSVNKEHNNALFPDEVRNQMENLKTTFTRNILHQGNVERINNILFSKEPDEDKKIKAAAVTFDDFCKVNDELLEVADEFITLDTNDISKQENEELVKYINMIKENVGRLKKVDVHEFESLTTDAKKNVEIQNRNDEKKKDMIISLSFITGAERVFDMFFQSKNGKISENELKLYKSYKRLNGYAKDSFNRLGDMEKILDDCVDFKKLSKEEAADSKSKNVSSMVTTVTQKSTELVNGVEKNQQTLEMSYMK